MKKIISILIAIFICVSMSVSAFAADKSLCSVNYTNASEFIFNPESGDLFSEFKGVMPGDKLTQEIVLYNQLATREVTLYMRAEIDDEYKEFLDYITIEVSLKESKNADTKVLSQNKASEPGALINNVNIGTYAPGEKGFLTVTINVDKSMGNEFDNAVGVIDWIFSAEEGEEIVTPPQPLPDTGSDSKSTVIAAVIGCCALGVVIFIFVSKKKKEKNETKPNK